MPNSTALLNSAPAEAPDFFLFSDEASHRHFRRTYRAARAAMAAGDDPLATFMGDPADAPLGPQRVNDYVGLMFGIELEYDAESYSSTPLTAGNFGTPLYEAGLLRSAYQEGYHARRHETQVWRWEEDGSVRGGEVITPVLRDNPDSWRTLAEVVNRMADNGALATAATGGHIHIDSSEIGGDEEWARFAKLLLHFEDELVRLAVNPWRQRHSRDGRVLRTWHRQIRFSIHDQLRPNLSSRSEVVEAMSSRSLPVTTNYVTNNGNGHIEFRLWDGSLRMPLIQMQAKITAAIVAAAMRPETDEFLLRSTPHPLGWHRAQPWRQESPGGGVRGEDWKNDTAGIKTLADILFPGNVADKEALITLFALNPWGRRTPLTSRWSV